MIEKPSWYSIKIDLFVEIPEKQSEISLCRSIKYDKICEKYVYKISFLNLIKLFIKNIFIFQKLILMIWHSIIISLKNDSSLLKKTLDSIIISR